MKIYRVALTFLLLGVSVGAQVAPPADPTNSADPVVAAHRTPEELDQLLAPIALYPDALIALILPASTVPTDIVLAARHVRDNPGDKSQIEHRAWDESVKSLTHYPEVLSWMDENLHWTRQVGEAFAIQPAEVMQSVQRLRAKARAAGTLIDTPQQQVIAEPQVIRIVPAQPDIIYVPHYQPEVVFVDRPTFYGSSFLTFGIGVPVGSWLAYDCDWRRNSIWVGNRHRRWTGHDWHRPLVPFAPSYSYAHNVRTTVARQWRPPPVPRITVTSSNRFRSAVVRPVPFGFSASRPHSSVHSTGIRPPQSRSTPSHTFRDSKPDGRTRSVDTPRVVPAVPRNFSPGFRNESVGPRVAAPVVTPAIPSSRISRLNTTPTTAPATSVQTSPPSRRFDGNGNGDRDSGNRARSFRSSPPAISTPLPVAPALPMMSSPRSIQPSGPSVPQRSFSRGSTASVGVPALPAQRSFSRGSSPPASLPAMPAQRSFSRGTSAPVSVPAMPVRNRSTPAPVMGPVAAPAAPAAAPATQPAAPSQRGGGETRGHRGASYRRGN